MCKNIANYTYILEANLVTGAAALAEQNAAKYFNCASLIP
jgi:hypothetical protein